ncbi:MAG: DNRLRE domain-containing protein, partial [Chloroflexi bacterium]|nr:DNRLRE domain-containing protein [Chloroflexota bacterium]
SNTFNSDTLDAPTGLTASGGSSVLLNWTATADTYATGHRVLRGTASGGPYSQVAEVTPRTTTTYDDSPAAGTYYYVVRAFYQSWESANSNETSESVGVRIDNQSSTQGEWVSSLSWSHTVGSGSNRLLVVGVSVSYAGTTVSGVTYGGTALTQVGVKDAPSSDGRVEIWRLLAPASGTANVVVSLTNGNLSTTVAGAVSFTDVHQTSPLGAFASASGASGNPSVAVSSAAGEVVVDTVMWNGSYTTLTVGAGQMQRWNRTTSGMIGAGSTEPGAASVTMSWTVNGGQNDSWAIGAVAVRSTTEPTLPETATFGASGDSYVKEDGATSNFGTDVEFWVKPDPTKVKRSLVAFDLSSIPAGSTVQSATLTLCISTVKAGRVHELRVVTSSWVETTVTWNSQPTVSGTVTGTIVVPAAQGCVDWTVTADVQAWVDGAANYGWRINDQNETTNSGDTKYRSRENGTVAQRPKLEVTYTPP